MKASEVRLANLPLGKEIAIEGVLHSDSVNVWMNDEPRSEEEQVVVVDPRVNALLLSSFPFRLGGVFAYYFQCKLQGILGFDEKQLPTVAELSGLELDVNGEKRKLI